MPKQLLSDAQRHVLETLAAGGMVIHQAGVRGALISYRLYPKDASGIRAGEDISPSTFSSLAYPRDYLGEIDYSARRIEPYKPRGMNLGMGHAYRISAKGREALKADRARRAAAQPAKERSR